MDSKSLKVATAALIYYAVSKHVLQMFCCKEFQKVLLHSQTKTFKQQLSQIGIKGKPADKRAKY